MERSSGWITEVRKLHLGKRPGKKIWDEVLKDCRKRLGMISADPQNQSEYMCL